MDQTKSVSQKPGRPATGHDPVLGVRVPSALVAQVVAWGAARGLGRSAAVRAALQAGSEAGLRPVAPKVVAEAQANVESAPAVKSIKGRHVGFDRTTGEPIYR